MWFVKPRLWRQFFCVTGRDSAAGAARVVFCSHMQPGRARGAGMGSSGIKKLMNVKEKCGK